MKRTAILGTVLSFCLLAAAPPAVAEERLSDREKAAIAALIVLGVAIAKHGKDHDSASQWDQNLYGQPFSPSRDVVCLPKPRKCYKEGHLSYRWTKRIFGA